MEGQVVVVVGIGMPRGWPGMPKRTHQLKQGGDLHPEYQRTHN